ncbi:MAG: hypothetical protein AAB787_00130 [Patescibacteria group bacterium]
MENRKEKKDKGEKKPTQWLIEPMNEAATTVLNDEFPGKDPEWVKDVKKKDRRVFRVTWEMVQKLMGSANQASPPKPTYRVYSQQGSSPAKRLAFFEPKKPRKSHKVSGLRTGAQLLREQRENVF